MIMSLIMNSCQCTFSLQIKLEMFIDCVLKNGRGQMTMLCTLIRGQMSYTFFQLGAHVLLCQLLGGGRCPHMPFFIGGTCRGGCPTLDNK